jgi:hypothetical protein
MLVEVDVFEPSKPSFPFRREEAEPVWISLKYERLDIYYTNCGRIGHKNPSCRAPTEDFVKEKYKISLKVNIFSKLLPCVSGA